MITPRLFRRSLRRGLQWRLLLLFWASLALPSAIAALPVFAFVRAQLDHSTQAPVPWLDGATLIELLRQLEENGVAASIGWSAAAGALVTLTCSPFVAAALVAAARTDERLRIPRLLAGAGELYGRLLRTLLAGLLPLGLAGAAAAAILRAATRINERVVTETAANRNVAIASAAAAILVFVGHLVVDAGRAQFAAAPDRRSALSAVWLGALLLVRRPARAFAIGLLGAALALGGAAILMTLRLHIAQASAWTIAGAWLLAQGALVAVGWGRAVRIFGLAELARTDAVDRGRAAIRTEPVPAPAAEVVQSTTLSALEPPRSGASR